MASVVFEIVLLALSPFDLAFMACVALKLVLIVCVAFSEFYAIVFPSRFFSWRVICQVSSTFLVCRVQVSFKCVGRFQVRVHGVCRCLK